MEWNIFPAKAFQQHTSTWDALNNRTYRTPLMESRFVSPLVNHFSDGSEILVLCTNNGQVIAGSILRRVSFGRWETFQPSQSPLGMWLSSKDAQLDALLKTLSKALPGIVFQIAITQQDPKLLLRPADEGLFSTLDYIVTGRLDIPSDFEEYRANLSKNVRQNTNRARNRIEKMGHTISFRKVSQPEMIQDAVVKYGEIESAGWKNESGTAVEKGTPQGNFYIEMLSNFSKTKCAIIWQYCYDDKVVATDLCVRNEKAIVILKTTYDEEQQKYSPAFCMHLEGIEWCGTQNLEEMEFYGPAMEWHQKLTQDLRTMFHINWSPSPIAKMLLNLIKALLSRKNG